MATGNVSYSNHAQLLAEIAKMKYQQQQNQANLSSAQEYFQQELSKYQSYSWSVNQTTNTISTGQSLQDMVNLIYQKQTDPLEDKVDRIFNRFKRQIKKELALSES